MVRGAGKGNWAAKLHFFHREDTCAGFGHCPLKAVITVQVIRFSVRWYIESWTIDLTLNFNFCLAIGSAMSLKWLWLFSGRWWKHTTAVFIASVATILYILAWACSTLLDRWLAVVPYIGSVQQMSHTWHALHLRCHQLLAWPFILLWGGSGYFSF